MGLHGWCSERVMVRWALVLLVAVACHAATLDSELGVGKSINIFMRYGYLSICMRVVPRNDTDGWVFREPTVNVFKDVDQLVLAPKPRTAKTLFDGDFHMEFCDNLKQLLQAYFRDFSFERLERPWRAFTAGWPTDIMARNLGINSSFITGDHCYVLVRVSRFRETAKLKEIPSDISVEDVVYEAIDETNVGDTVSIADFIRKYGSHYIASYVTGNSLYQVFVFSRGVYSRIRERVKSKGVGSIPPADIDNYFSPLYAEHIGAVKVFVFSRTVYSVIKERLKSKGVGDITAKELEGYFSPWQAKHIGQIKVASGNKTVESWAMKKLRVHYYIFSYPSLLKLHGEPALLRNLDTLLGNEALLQLELKTLSPAFKDVKKKKWFEEVIDNYLKLWESNM
ncbi:torso-like protein isoform X3 [Danaus plexippus]|nr:torso-like protein isoform X3 [Danaus plexippus]